MKIYANANFTAERLKRGFTMVTLGEASGLSHNAIFKIESRSNAARPINAKRIVDALEVEFDDIFELVSGE